VRREAVSDNLSDARATGEQRDFALWVHVSIAERSQGRPGDTFIYATDFRNNRVVAWNSAFGFDATLTSKFKDSRFEIADSGAVVVNSTQAA